MEHVCFYITCLQPLFNQLSTRGVTDGIEDKLVTDVIECATEISIENPRVSALAQSDVALSDGIVAASTGAEAIAVRFEGSFPAGLDCILNNCLSDAVGDSRNTQRPQFPARLWDVIRLVGFTFQGGYSDIS